MGQYYAIAMKDSNGDIEVNHRKLKGHDYIMAKLLEHSWMKNDLLCTVCAKLEQFEPCRIAWVGDYANEKNEDGEEELFEITHGDISYADVWGEHQTHEVVWDAEPFDPKGKYLINHTKKVYLSFDKYIEKNEKDGWCLHPLSLLTAVGNGRGGGDYYEELPDYDQVGTWAWDEIEIHTEVPHGFNEVEFNFKDKEEK